MLRRKRAEKGDKQYDAGNRLTEAVDSAGGVITRSYDDVNRVVTETTPQGSVTYNYDAAGRRAGMTVAGQPQLHTRSTTPIG